MDIKELRLEFEALFTQVVYGHGYLHYGYWKEGHADEISLKRLGEAQQDYFNQIADLIPEGVHRILDVGSGTGSNASSLVQKGYLVDCVCPSPMLNQLTRAKLPPESQLFECTFENFNDDISYDLLLFSESFHYIDCHQALSQINRYAKKHVIIFDYFPRMDKDSVTADRPSYHQFLNVFSVNLADKFEINLDRDVTGNIVPTFEVLDKIKNDHINPFLLKFIDNFKKDHPYFSLLLSPLLKKMAKSFHKKSDRYHSFPERFEYRLILLSRRLGQ